MTTHDPPTPAASAKSVEPAAQAAQAAPGGARPAFVRLLLVGGGALVVRLVYWAAFLRHYAPVSDAAQYITIAHNFATGRGIANAYPQVQVHATAFRPPLYPALLGLLFKVFGTHVAVAQAANAVIGALVVVLVLVLVTRIAGPRAALGAAVIVALTPSLLANDLVPLSEPLSLLIFLAIVLLLIDERWVAGGLATGLLLLTRPSAPALVAAASVWLVSKFGLNVVLRFAGAAFLTVVPWVVRNELRLHSPVLVTSNGFNVNAVYSPEAVAHGGFVDATVNPELVWVRPVATDEAKWDRTLLQHGIFGARTHPVAVAENMIRNVARMAELAPASNEVPEWFDGRNLTFRTLTLPLFYLASLLGLLGLWRHRGNHGVMVLLVLGLALVAPSVATVAVPRLRGPLDLVVAVGAGLFVASRPAWPRWPARLTISHRITPR